MGLLRDWEAAHFASQAGHDLAQTSGTTPESANLLLAHHLTVFKVYTALSPSEDIFLTPASLASFEAILESAAIIIAQRSSTVTQEGNFAQLVSLFSLEMSSAEALYYTAIKCRQPTYRRYTVELLKQAGREGVWDGSTMAKITEHIISIEEDRLAYSSSSSDDSVLGEKETDAHSSTIETFLSSQLNNYFSLNEDLSASSLYLSPQVESKGLINEVTFTVDREQNTIQVTCARYVELLSYMAVREYRIGVGRLRRFEQGIGHSMMRWAKETMQELVQGCPEFGVCVDFK